MSEKYNFFRKSIQVLFVLLFLEVCTKIASENLENVSVLSGMTSKWGNININGIIDKENIKKVSQYSHSYYLCKDIYKLETGFSFDIIQVCGMEDKVLEKKINDSLNQYLYTLEGDCFSPENVKAMEPTIHCQSSEYLSVQYDFDYLPDNIHFWNFCVTVDMRSGEVVFLDDLVALNREFTTLVKNGTLIQMDAGQYLSAEENTACENRYFSEQTAEGILDAFRPFTRDYLYGDVYADFTRYNTYFYLEKGYLCFKAVNSDSFLIGKGIIKIPLEKVAELMKMPESVLTDSVHGQMQTTETDEEFVTCGYRVFEDKYTLESGLCFNTIQVCNMKNKELENRINNSLNRYLNILKEPWFGIDAVEDKKPIIHCQTAQYLSVEYLFKIMKPMVGTYDFTYWHFCVTVDMQTGEVVFLDDLTELDTEFAMLIQNGNILKDYMVSVWMTAEEATEKTNRRYSQMDTEDILSKLQPYTKEFLYKDDIVQYEHDIGYLYDNYFYLEEGALCFKRDFFMGNEGVYKILTKDIETYLKVPKW